MLRVRRTTILVYNSTCTTMLVYIGDKDSRILWNQFTAFNSPLHVLTTRTHCSRSKHCRWTVYTQNRCMNTATIQEMVIWHARKLARRVISVAINIPTLLTALPKASSVATVASWITFLVFAGQNHNSSLCNMFIRCLTVTIVLHRPCNMICLMILTTAMSSPFTKAIFFTLCRRSYPPRASLSMELQSPLSSTRVPA